MNIVFQKRKILKGNKMTSIFSDTYYFKIYFIPIVPYILLESQ